MAVLLTAQNYYNFKWDILSSKVVDCVTGSMISNQPAKDASAIFEGTAYTAYPKFTTDNSLKELPWMDNPYAATPVTYRKGEWIFALNKNIIGTATSESQIKERVEYVWAENLLRVDLPVPADELEVSGIINGEWWENTDVDWDGLGSETLFTDMSIDPPRFMPGKMNKVDKAEINYQEMFDRKASLYASSIIDETVNEYKGPGYEGTFTDPDRKVPGLVCSLETVDGKLYIRWSALIRGFNIGANKNFYYDSGSKTSNGYAIFAVTKSIVFTVKGKRYDEDILTFEFGVSSDKAEHPYKIQRNELMSPFTKINGNSWDKQLSESLITAYKNGRRTATCKVTAKWFLENNIKVGTDIQVFDIYGKALRKNFLVVGIVKYCTAYEITFNLKLLEV